MEIVPNYTKWAEGSVLCACGDTQVLCTASVETRLPPWMADGGRGWVTAEYAMLPRSTDRRNRRESSQGKPSGRSQEISRLIGRSLRAAVDLNRLGEVSVTVDCDVIQADGGTRCASITGGWVALALAIRGLQRTGQVQASPMTYQVAALSLGVVDGRVVADLDSTEDQRAETDLNLVMTQDGAVVEIQGTAEKAPLLRSQLDEMLNLGAECLMGVMQAQARALESAE